MACPLYIKNTSELNYSRSIFIIVLIILCKISLAQAPGKDFKDVMRKWKNDTTLIPVAEINIGKTYANLLPIVGYAPANGFVLGSAVSLIRLFGKPPTTLSSAMVNAQITSKRQIIVNARSKVYLNDNKWFLQGEWRFLIFKQPTYGLGIISPKDQDIVIGVNNLPQTLDSIAEPLSYNLIRIYEEAVRQLFHSHYYAGIGICYDHHFNIVDERLDTLKSSPDYFISSHYAYSLKNNFDPKGYHVAGMKVTLLTDTRDNLINCYKGYYVSVSMLHNQKLNRDSRNSDQLLYDARYYLDLSKSKPGKVIAFWSWGNFLLAGNHRYLPLPSIGWDTYNRSGRGYIQGRYRGLNFLYNEVEYRFPISKNGFLGGVAFVNATNANDYGENIFDKTALGMGAGLRLKLDKRSRTNITIDLGYGADRSSGIYINMQEMF